MTREPVMPTGRAAVFTAVCLGLSVAAHRVMSQAAVPVWAVVLGAMAVYVPARLGARRERGLLQITALMGGLQIALHFLFAYAQGVAASSAPVSMPGMAMPAGTSMSMPGMAMPGPDAALRTSTGMLLAHVIAASVCAWWLRRGEAAVHAAVRSVGQWIAAHLVVPVLAQSVPARDESLGLPVEPVALALRAQWLRVSRALRGPPLSPSFT